MKLTCALLVGCLPRHFLSVLFNIAGQELAYRKACEKQRRILGAKLYLLRMEQEEFNNYA